MSGSFQNLIVAFIGLMPLVEGNLADSDPDSWLSRLLPSTLNSDSLAQKGHSGLFRGDGPFV